MEAEASRSEATCLRLPRESEVQGLFSQLGAVGVTAVCHDPHQPGLGSGKRTAIPGDRAGSQ